MASVYSSLSFSVDYYLIWAAEDSRAKEVGFNFNYLDYKLLEFKVASCGAIVLLFCWSSFERSILSVFSFLQVNLMM